MSISMILSRYARPTSLHAARARLAWALTLLVACGGGGGSAPLPTTLAVSPDSVVLARGSTVQLTALGRLPDGSGRPDFAAVATWSSSAPEVASVSAGLVTGLADGTAVITAALGKLTSTSTVVVGHPLKAFLTAVTGTGDLSTWPGAGGKSGLAAADSVCQASAEEAGLPGTFRAWLSDSRDDGWCRAAGLSGRVGFTSTCGGELSSPPDAGPWVRMDGVPFAPTASRLALYDVYVPIRFDAHGREVEGVAWDSSHSYPVCQDWTSAAPDPSPGAKRPEGIDPLGTRLDSRYLSCDSLARLLCIEIGLSVPAPLPAQPPATKLAFITSVTGSGKLSTWPDSGGQDGLAGADAVCRARAAAARLPNADRFKAWLADGTSGPLARLTSDGPWMRVDGVPLAGSRAELGSLPLFTTLDRTESDMRQLAQNAWTGTTDPETSGRTCAAWSSDSSGSGDIGASNTLNRWSSFTWYVPCSQREPLYCFED